MNPLEQELNGGHPLSDSRRACLVADLRPEEVLDYFAKVEKEDLGKAILGPLTRQALRSKMKDLRSSPIGAGAIPNEHWDMYENMLNQYGNP